MSRFDRYFRFLGAAAIPVGLLLSGCDGPAVGQHSSAVTCPPPPCPDQCLDDRTSDECLKLIEETGADCPPPPPPEKKHCNQGVGNGPEGCDPGNSNNHNTSNDENGGVPGAPGRQGPK